MPKWPQPKPKKSLLKDKPRLLLLLLKKKRLQSQYMKRHLLISLMRYLTRMISENNQEDLALQLPLRMVYWFSIYLMEVLFKFWMGNKKMVVKKKSTVYIFPKELLSVTFPIKMLRFYSQMVTMLNSIVQLFNGLWLMQKVWDAPSKMANILIYLQLIAWSKQTQILVISLKWEPTKWSPLNTKMECFIASMQMELKWWQKKEVD
jgi:hypothetical protein